MWQNVAFILIGLGILVLIGWAVQGFFTASDISLLIRIAVGVVGVGVLILNPTYSFNNPLAFYLL